MGPLALAVLSTSIINVQLANAEVFGNPVLHEVRIDDDMIQATLIWSTSSTSDEDQIDDYAYTPDGLNYVSLFGSYNSNYVSESQTTTIRMPSRANAKAQIYAIGKVEDNRISSSSNFIRAKISEQPIPTKVEFQNISDGKLVYKITSYNVAAVNSGAIKYKVSQIKTGQKSKVRIDIEENLILISNFTQGERISFRTIKYVNLCDGFSPFLSCPYNSKVDVKVDWAQR